MRTILNSSAAEHARSIEGSKDARRRRKQLKKNLEAIGDGIEHKLVKACGRQVVVRAGTGDRDAQAILRRRSATLIGPRGYDRLLLAGSASTKLTLHAQHA